MELRGPVAVPAFPHQGEGADLNLIKQPLETELRERVTTASGIELRDYTLCENPGPDHWELL